MATITRFPFVSYLRSDTTMHVQHVRGGQVRHEATAAGFWFNPRTAVLAEVAKNKQDTIIARKPLPRRWPSPRRCPTG